MQPLAGASTSTVALRTALIACNVYVSAGANPAHRPLLLQLLERAQQQHPPSSQELLRAVVVHAYADTVYDRSSFHLAGHAEAVARVASDLAVTAVQELRALDQNNYSSNNHHSSMTAAAASASTATDRVAHPFVGLVDHVSMMPLTTLGSSRKQGGSEDDKDDDSSLVLLQQQQQKAAGWAARDVGSNMEKKLGRVLDVLFYGMAHPDQTPLAAVRRERTAFFQSGGLAAADDDADGRNRRQTVTVGAPEQFVENYNVRLARACSRTLAQSLARRIRERDGGLPGVEALTLPYSQGRWEVACNLLRPCTTGATATDIQNAVDRWEKEQNQGSLVETGYRVGTTVEQCLEAWERSTASDIDRQCHDQLVFERLRGYLRS